MHASATVTVIAGLALSMLLFFVLPAEGSLFPGIHWVKETAIFLAQCRFHTGGIVRHQRPYADERRRAATGGVVPAAAGTPVGQLPEDVAPAGADPGAVLAFRLVGVCTLLIGLLMLGSSLDGHRSVRWLTSGRGLAALLAGPITGLSYRVRNDEKSQQELAAATATLDGSPNRD